MKPTGYSLGTIIAGFLLIGYVYWADPTTAPAQLPLIIAGITGLVTLLQKQADSDSKTADVKAVAIEAKTAAKVATVEAVKSKEVSRKNAETLAVMVESVGAVVESVETVHGIVNHQKDLVTNELAESRKTNEALTREIAGLHAAFIAVQADPGSPAAAALAAAIQVHPLDTPTPAADAVKAADAAKPPTTKPIRMPPDQPKTITGDHS